MFLINGNEYYTEATVIGRENGRLTLCVYNNDKKSAFLSVAGKGVAGEGNFQYLPIEYLEDYLRDHNIALDILASSYPALVWFFRAVIENPDVREIMGEESFADIRETLEDKRYQ